jgi:hypothetical protein
VSRGEPFFYRYPQRPSNRFCETTVMAKGQMAKVAFLAVPATLLFIEIGAAQRHGQSLPSLIVTPSTGIDFSGPQGGPFSPLLVEYRISASIGTVSYSIRTPSWLTASSSFGLTDKSGITITLKVNASASGLRPGAYGPGVAFTNVSNGQGSTRRPAKLIVRAPAISGQTSPIRRGRGGHLLDSRGGYLLDDDHGGRLMAE